MFRKQRRVKKIISDEQCKALLKTERRGVIAVNGDDGYPYAVPVNYFYDEAAGKIYIHGARAGHKYDSLKKDDKVCFTVYGAERPDENESWAPWLTSVVIFGRCELAAPGEAAMDFLRTVAAKYYPGPKMIDEEIAANGRAVQMYVITIEHMSGKFIQEK